MDSLSRIRRPDFSVYRDMPLVMQQWNIYRHMVIRGISKQRTQVFKIGLDTKMVLLTKAVKIKRLEIGIIKQA